MTPRHSVSPSRTRPSNEGSKVGFPIRKSSDQSAFAAPRGLSQRTTSFIASQRQGIHRMPFVHLIAPMIHARPSEETAPRDHGNVGPSRTRRTEEPSCPCRPEGRHGQIQDQRRPCPPRLAPRRSTIVTYAERARQADLAIGPVSQTRPSSSRCQTSPPKPKPRGEPLLFHGYSRRHTPAPSASADHLVEPDGIEPTTSCLQSTRSPN